MSTYSYTFNSLNHMRGKSIPCNISNFSFRLALHIRYDFEIGKCPSVPSLVPCRIVMRGEEISLQNIRCVSL